MAAVLSQQLPQRRRRRAQAAGFAEGNFDSILGNRQRVTFGMIGRRITLAKTNGWSASFDPAPRRAGDGAPAV